MNIQQHDSPEQKLTETPRTDEICQGRNCAYWGVPRAFAEQLERELSIAISQRDALRANFQEYRDRAEHVEAEVAELREKASLLDTMVSLDEERLSAKARLLYPNGLIAMLADRNRQMHEQHTLLTQERDALRKKLEAILAMKTEGKS